MRAAVLTGTFAMILVAVFQVNALHDFMRVTRESVKACPICFGNGETQEKALKKCYQNTKYQTCPPDLPLPVCVTKDIKTGSVLQLMAHEVTRQCLSSIGFDQSSFGYQEHICLEAMRNRGNNKPCVIGKCDEDRCKAEIPDLD